MVFLLWRKRCGNDNLTVTNGASIAESVLVKGQLTVQVVVSCG